MYRIILLIWVQFFPVLTLRAQAPFLRLDKPGTNKDINYFAGDKIVYRMNWEKKIRHDEITGFTDSTIVFEYFDIRVKDIAFVRTEHTGGFLSPSNGPKLVVAGIALPLIDFLNVTVVQGGEYSFDQGIMIVSGALVATGLFWSSLRYEKFKPGHRRRLIISMY